LEKKKKKFEKNVHLKGVVVLFWKKGCNGGESPERTLFRKNDSKICSKALKKGMSV